jgi:hypothetical protein
MHFLKNQCFKYILAFALHYKNYYKINKYQIFKIPHQEVYLGMIVNGKRRSKKSEEASDAILISL